MARSHKIKQVIQSTEKTAVITKAMQLVNLAKEIMQHYSELSNHPYFKKRQKAKAHGVIIITSDRGLCGNLNLQLFKQILQYIK